MKRYFLFDKYNTWYDWGLTLTGKELPDPELKTHYVDIDGAHGTLDFTEALTGGPVYGDRTVTASFMTSQGTYQEREAVLRSITAALHGRKVKIVEPDDPEHYFLGRVTVKPGEKHLAYATLDIEAICDPWRYAVNETVRRVDLVPTELSLPEVDVVLRNDGDKPICPTVTVAGDPDGSLSMMIYLGAGESGADNAYQAEILYNGVYISPDIVVPARGVYTVRLMGGSGTVTFTYREASL